MILQIILAILLLTSLLCAVYGIARNILAFIGAAMVITNIVLIISLVTQIAK